MTEITWKYTYSVSTKILTEQYNPKTRIDSIYIVKKQIPSCVSINVETMRIWSKTSRWSILKVVYPLENLRSARIVQVVWFHVGMFAQWPTKHRGDGFVVDKFTEELFSFEKKNNAAIVVVFSCYKLTQPNPYFSKA